VLVHVAIMLLGLVTLSGFVLDYGVFWVARRQAQNAADAGALAAAMSLADSLDKDEAHKAGIQTAKLNIIWGEALPENGIIVDVDGSEPEDSPPLPAAACNAPASDCVRVSVFRDVKRGNPLPTYFLQLANVMQQEVRATAVAKVAGANSVKCLMPLILADRWNDIGSVPGEYDLGDHYGPGIPPLGTGFTPSTDIPGQITLTQGPSTVSTLNGFIAFGVANEDELDMAMLSCTISGWIGQTVTSVPESFSFGLDENFLALSGRVVYFPVYNPHDYLLSGSSVLKITNIVPFKVEDSWVSGSQFYVQGTFLTTKGDLYKGEGAEYPEQGTAFLRSVVQLIR
jgi:hypothetical protein